MNQTNHSSEPSTSKRGRRRLLIACGIGLVILLALPWVLAKTSLRDRLLTAIVNSDQVTVQSQNASFGYVSPLSLSGLQIESKDQATRIEVANIEADHSWLGLLLSRPELGTFRFDRPRVDVLIDQQQQPAGKPSPPGVGNRDKVAPVELPTLSAEIQDAAVVVRTPDSADPPIDIEGVSVSLRLQREQNRSVLRIDPATIFDHQQITPQLCGHGLQLVAPLIADAIDAQGEFSLRIDEFHVPLGNATAADGSAIRIEGELELHQASVALKNTIASDITTVVFGWLGGAMPETMTVAKGVTVSFQVIDGRIHHQGLALLLPRGDSSIEIVSSGSVGLDESIDLQVAIQLPGGLLGNTAFARRLMSDPMVISFAGTLDNPKIGLPKNAGWIQSIEGLIPDDDDPSGASLERAVTDIIGELLDRTDGGASEGEKKPTLQEGLLPDLLERLGNPRRRDEGSDSPETPPKETDSDAVPADI